MNLSPEQQAELTRRVEVINRKQGELSRQLDELERQIKVMRRDISDGSLPRYHGHIATTARRIDEIGITMVAINSY